MRNRFRIEQIQEFYITPTVTQDGMVPIWNNSTKRFDWGTYSYVPAGSHSVGVKQTGVDAGTLWDMSITDDYFYICVQTGVVGVAIWKKILLFHT